MFKIIKKRTYFYIFSLILTLVSIVSIFVWGFNYSIDFRGGSSIEIILDNPDNNVDKIKEATKELDITADSVRVADDNKIIIRTEELSSEKHENLLRNINSKITDGVQEDNYQTVGPSVSRDLTKKAIWSVVLASIAIIFYIAFAFRRIPKPFSSWHFGMTAVVALLHDLIITTGFVSIVGHFYDWMHVDSLFITALLTIMGFSVHDTIVVFDRLRENLIKHPENNIEELANDSILQTISRSINTSLTTIMVLVALFLIGGESIKHFVLILIAGMTFGTYSSIFIATMTLVSWSRSLNTKIGR